MKISRFFLALVFLCVLFAAAPCRCENDGREYVIQGEVTSFDWVGGIMVIRCLREIPTIGYYEVTLKVPRDIRIMKGTDTVGFDDVNQFDRVTVRYKASESNALPVVVNMTIADST